MIATDWQQHSVRGFLAGVVRKKLGLNSSATMSPFGGNEAEADLTNAIRLSPRDPALDRWYGLLGIANLFLGRLEPALDRLRKSVEMNPHVALFQFFLAAASALSGRANEAQDARDAGLRLDPNFTVARFRNEARSKNATFLAQRERINGGLRLAGVPEGQVAVGTASDSSIG